MRSSLLLVLSFVAVGLSAAPAQAQVYASNGLPAARRADRGNGLSSDPVEMVVLMGKITSPAGPLPGAVVILSGTKQMAVTNAQGEFEFTVPANAGTLEARVTYAGYADEKMTLNAAADESTVSLTNARVIVVSRKQQLKKYMKTAHKQIKRELKKVRSK